MAEEITAVSDDGGKALVRERVDAMSEDLRRLLQDAITEKYRARVRARRALPRSVTDLRCRPYTALTLSR